MEKVLKTDFGYDLRNDSLTEIIDFGKYDYVVSYQKEVLNMEYDLNYAKKYDHCEYIKGLKPIKVLYSASKVNHKLFIYRIFEKNKYRHLCP